MREPLRFRQITLASLQLLFLQFQGLDRESSIRPGRQQSQPEDNKGDGCNSGGAECRDAYRVRQVRWHAGGRETGGGHAGVMHDGDRGAHHNGSGYLFPADRLFLISEVKGNPKRGERNQNREHDGNYVEKKIKLAYGSYTHGGDAD